MARQYSSSRGSYGGTGFEMEALCLGASLPDAIPCGGHSGFALAVFTLPLPNSLGQGQCPKLPFQPHVAFETVQQGVLIV